MMYVPIILSAFYFEVKGALIAAFLGGFALGPLMPENVSLGLMQEPISWIFRLALFIVIGIIISILFKRINNYKIIEIERAYKNLLTGLPNINKLKSDLDKMMANEMKFSLMGFRIINIHDINQYISYEIGSKSIKKVAEILTSDVNYTIYSVFTNEFAVVLPNVSIKDAKIIGMQFLNKVCEPILIDRISVKLLVKGSIVNFPLQVKDSYDLIKKMGVALDQKASESGLNFYDTTIEKKSKKKSELLASLFSAIENEEFYMVYQPIKKLKNDSIIEVEALLRWKYGIKKQINTSEMIQVAEKVGFISEITKWVIKNVIEQAKKWQDEGIFIKVGLNISSKDLRDHSVIDYLIETIEKNHVETSMIVVELTERCILETKENVMELFYILKEKGSK